MWTQVSLAAYFNLFFLPTPMETGSQQEMSSWDLGHPQGAQRESEWPSFLQLNSWLRQISTDTPGNVKPTNKSGPFDRWEKSGNYHSQLLHHCPRSLGDSNINLLIWRVGVVDVLNMPEPESLPTRRSSGCSLPRNDETCRQLQFSPCSFFFFF